MKNHHVLGLMAGITIGLAMWGASGQRAFLDEIRTVVITDNTVSGKKNYAAYDTKNYTAAASSDYRIDADKPASVNGAAAQGAIAQGAIAQGVIESESTDNSPAVKDEVTQRNGAKGIGCTKTDTMCSEILKNLHAGSAVLMDADSGRILFEKNGKEIRPMASTTKIMTCILALESADPDTVCTVSSTAAAQPKVHLGARKGSEFYLKDILYSLMLESHNDSAVMIAECVGGTVEHFAELMNQKAKEIGCENTYFVTPNGLDGAKNMPDGSQRIHATTAAELARILRYCLMESPQKEEFRKITGTMDHVFSDRTGKQHYSCHNHNALISMYPGVFSGKTGFTGGAGYSYVGACESEGRTFIIALLGCGWPPHKTWKWNDAQKLLAFGEDFYQYQDIFVKQKDIRIPVGHGIAETVLCRAESAVEQRKDYRVLLSDRDEIQVKREMRKSLSAPVRAGTCVGKIHYYLNGEEIFTDPVIAVESVEERNYLYCLRKILRLFS